MKTIIILGGIVIILLVAVFGAITALRYFQRTRQDTQINDHRVQQEQHRTQAAAHDRKAARQRALNKQLR